MNGAIKKVVRAANEASSFREGDYTKNGLLYCGKCNTPKQTHVPWLGVVGCMCECEDRQYKLEEDERQRRELVERVMRLRGSGIEKKELRNASFAEDDGKMAEAMKKLCKYAERWQEMLRENVGLVLYGGVGTGKSYGAACVANSLIDRGIPVYMTSCAEVIRKEQRAKFEDKGSFIDELMEYPLLILDDFGAERQSDYALEVMYSVVNDRYECNKPLIITTNLPYTELENPTDLKHKRIYDRVVEMCRPINFGNNGRRKDLAREKTKRAAELLREE